MDPSPNRTRSHYLTLTPLLIVAGWLFVSCVVPTVPPNPTGTTSTTTAPSTTIATTTTTGSMSTPVSTAAAVQGAAWGSNSKITLGSGTFNFTSDGIPNHSRPAQILAPKPGIRVPTSTADMMVINDPTG